MSQAGKLLSSLDAHKKVVRLGSETGDVPFSSLFSKPLLVGRISTLDGVDYVVITAFEEESDISTADTQLAELLKALSSRARQLTALNQERQRTGLLNLMTFLCASSELSSFPAWLMIILGGGSGVPLYAVNEALSNDEVE